MIRNARIPFIGILFVLTASCGTLKAHNLFVFIERQAKGPDLVDIIFEHSPYPGSGTYNQPHLERGKTWVQTVGSTEKVSLTLTEQTRLGKKFLQAETEIKAPRIIVHSCKWGVYKGRLDFFHGKYIDVTSKDQLSKCARTDELPLDLVPSFDGDALRVSVRFKDELLADTRVSIWPPSGKETNLTSDSTGAISVPNPNKGTWSFSAVHTISGESGEFKGEAYEGLMHGATLNLRLPLE